MPKLTDENLETINVKGTNFQYSAVRLDKLGATEYTLVSIITDISGSVSGYKNELEKCLQEILKSCRKSPRSDNLMLRLLTFNTNVDELHGYKLLSECNPDDYVNILNTGGMTSLYDASYNGILSASDYAKTLTDNDFDVNGIIFIVTDGMDNTSTYSPNSVSKAMQESLKNEYLESLTVVLIGLNLEPDADSYLQDFQKQANLTKYINIGDADEKALAKLAEFVSKSISSSSTSLGTGQAPSLSF